MMTEAERSRIQEAIALSQTSIGDDLEAQKVIREAREDEQRRQARQHIHEKELLELLGLSDVDAVQAHLSELVQAGFPFSMDGSSAVVRTVRTDMLGRKHPSLVALRYEIERWLQALDATVRRMGYVKPKTR